MTIDPCAEGCLNHQIGAGTGPSAADDPCNSANNGYFCQGSYWTYDPTAPGADTATYGDCPRAWIRTGGDCNVDQWLEISVANVITDTVPPVNGVDCCPSGTIWCVPAVAPETLNRIYIQTSCTGDNCQWCKICGHAHAEINVDGTPLTLQPEGVQIQIPFDTVVYDTSNMATVPTFTVPETGCYMVSAWALFDYTSINFDASLLRLILTVNGVAQYNIQDIGGWDLNRPLFNFITMPIAGSSFICVNAGDQIGMNFIWNTNFGGSTIDLTSAIMRIKEMKS